MGSVLGANRDDIQTGGSVVEPPETDRATMVPLGIVGHAPIAGLIAISRRT
jgi:hypothetical protein